MTRPHILTYTDTVAKIRSLDFKYLDGGTYEELKTAKATIRFATLLDYAHMPLEQSQVCWQCGTGNGTIHGTDRSLSIFEDYEDGHELFLAKKCGFRGDIVEFWFWLVQACHNGLPNGNWSRLMAARDLLTRESRGLLNPDVELIGASGSSSRRDPNDPILKYGRMLDAARAACESKTYNHPSVALPEPIPIPYTKVITDIFKENKLIWIARRVEDGRAHKRDYYLKHPDVQDSSFWIPCYLETNWRNRKNLGERLFTVIDMDKRFSKEQQHRIALQLSIEVDLLYLVDTGGKGLHAAYDTRDFELESICELYRIAVEDYGLDDIVAFRPEQPVRFPGGWNRDKNNRQNILLWNL